MVQLREGFTFELLTLTMYPHYAAGQEPSPNAGPVPVNHTIALTMDEGVSQIALERPFRMQTLAVEGREGEDAQILDELDDSEDEGGVELLLEDPSFPQCYSQEDGQAGGAAKIRIEGLPPNSPIRGLLDTRLVFTGVADEGGGGMIDLSILDDVAEGLHLVTIEVADTALAANCTVNVTGEGPVVARPLKERDLLRDYVILLKGQQRLLNNFGLLIRESAAAEGVSGDRLLMLADKYEQLLNKHTELLERLEVLMRRTAR